MIALRHAIALLLALAAGSARAETPNTPLQLERTIVLPDVVGRIDHLAIDLGRNRLFVAELGNGTLGVIDLATGRSIDRIGGLDEPQGVAYVAASDRIAVACGGDGTVHVFRGDDFAPVGTLDLGDDADNVRVDPRNGHIFVGHGSGGIAELDPISVSKLAEFGVGVHPEGFRLSSDGRRIFVNLPDARRIGVLDLESKSQASWTVPDLRSNFPLAIDTSGTLLATVFRNPPRLVLLDAQSGAVVANVDACGDADDVFFDAKRERIYVSCGEGAVDVFQSDRANTQRVARVATPPGGRTSLFVPELDQLFVAVRARLLHSEASILVFRPMP